ncbi:MAG: EAL domain-containing protein [Terracidiphilus sp.]|jgi:diguanylate cyclase (GGDEF)-like protein/PAS domain S-box-containing protein
MREVASVDRNSKALARNAILIAASLALFGSGIGLFGVLRGAVSSEQTIVILSGGVFGSGILLSQLFHRWIPAQTVATASTIFYGAYLCAGIIISIFTEPDHHSVFVYVVWFFPLLVFNKLVNSPAVSRVLAKFVILAPLAIIACLFPSGQSRNFPMTSLLVLIGSCLGYACYAMMLNAVTRYREAYIVERERAESLRIESEVLESISDCFVSLDSEFRLVYMNDAACAEFGVERSAALNRTIPEALPHFCSQLILAKLKTASRQDSASVFEAHCEKQGRWYEMRCFPQAGRMSLFFRNITESVMSRSKLEAAHNRVREQSELLDKAQDAIFVQDLESRVLYWNKGAERLFGWAADEVMGRRVADVFYQTFTDVKNAFSATLKQGEWKGEMPKRHKGGKLLIVESRTTLVRDDEGNPTSILAINTDITERKAADSRIHHLAFYDVLTGLPNRVLLRERLESALAADVVEKHPGALLLIDLDDFKTLNDTVGHDIGDLLLQAVGTRLTACVRKVDTVARLGGDEFGVMLEGLSTDLEIAASEVAAVGEKILRACRQAYSLEHYKYDGTTSIGAALFEGTQDTVDELLKRTDLAMYQAKAQGRDSLCFFDPAMESSASARAALLADLKHALQNREFELHYQPQLDSDGRVTGAEALLRWRHAERGMVPPSEFIPLAEAAGLIVDLGHWVLETACSQIAEWERMPEMAGLNIAVNVSIRQFLDSSFVQLVEKVLRESEADPHMLKLEITESFMMEKANDTVAKMTALKVLGVGFSMDDFGTGYSSLSQLKRLPLDQLKIDQSFVRDVMNGPREASIVRTIITLGRSLNMSVIAEGVETEEQREFLKSNGCHAYQGYLFSRALLSADFEAFVGETYRLREIGRAWEPPAYANQKLELTVTSRRDDGASSL